VRRTLAARFADAWIGAYRFGVRARSKAFSALAANAFARFGPHAVIQPPVRLVGERHIAIGRDVFVGAGSWLQTLVPEHSGVALEIGDGTSIAGNCVLSAAHSVRLGRKVLLARNVYISDHIHAYRDTAKAVLDQGLDRIDQVDVDDGAWLGQNVVVCPGVRIGKGAVIGANAVVVDDIPDHCLAVGAPATVVRTFSPEGSAR